MHGDADQKKKNPTLAFPHRLGARDPEAGKYLAFTPLGCLSWVNQRLLGAGVCVNGPAVRAVDAVLR